LSRITRDRTGAILLVTFETIRKIALSLNDVEETTSYGTAALRVSGTLFAQLRQDSEPLALRMDRDEREELMAADPVRTTSPITI
jgi:hypothetical protein